MGVKKGASSQTTIVRFGPGGERAGRYESRQVTIDTQGPESGQAGQTSRPVTADSTRDAGKNIIACQRER
jgi:hypothetical protein